MKITTEKSIRDFQFWAGAADVANYLTGDELDTIEQILEDGSSDGMSETELNNFFWFENDLIAEWLGYEDFEALMEREDNPLNEN